MKRLSALLLIPALLLVGCAADRGDTTTYSDKTYYQKRADDVAIRQDIKIMSDGSQVICTIAMSPDLKTMDCVVVPAQPNN